MTSHEHDAERSLRHAIRTASLMLGRYVGEAAEAYDNEPRPIEEVPVGFDQARRDRERFNRLAQELGCGRA